MDLGYQYTVYIWPMLASAAWLLALSAYAWRHRATPGALAFAVATLFTAAAGSGNFKTMRSRVAQSMSERRLASRSASAGEHLGRQDSDACQVPFHDRRLAIDVATLRYDNQMSLYQSGLVSRVNPFLLPWKEDWRVPGLCLTGCAGTNGELDSERRLTAVQGQNIGSEVREAILAGNVFVGMSDAMVTAAWELPRAAFRWVAVRICKRAPPSLGPLGVKRPLLA